MPASRPARQGIAHDLLGLADDGLEVLLVPEALRRSCSYSPSWTAVPRTSRSGPRP
jgi:hypothetical protein